MLPEIKKSILSSLEKSTMYSLLKDGKRIDGRNFYDIRSIRILPSIIEKAEGSALVYLGNTKVLAGVKVSLARPFEDMPNQGLFVTGAELTPVASPAFELGPPSYFSIELARVVDRAIRSSEMIDLEKLVIIPGEIVWMINIDIYPLDDDGNLIDASMLAVIAALMTTEIPKSEIVDPEKGKVDIIKDEKRPLPLVDLPISLTFAKIGDYILLDPSSAEENIMQNRLTIAINNKGEICSIQKGEGGGFKFNEVIIAKNIAIEKVNEVRKLVVNQLAKNPRGPNAWEYI
ncbi:MAG: exosome complex protein Rrp42 [Candidatus Njordarchaeales archaeon]